MFEVEVGGVERIEGARVEASSSQCSLSSICVVGDLSMSTYFDYVW